MKTANLENFIEYGQLFEVYGSLLSEDRQKIMTSYFEFNMTLVEIAQERGISRQAVLDAIRKSCSKLQNYENALKIVAKKKALEGKLSELLEIAKQLSDKKVAKKVEEILKEI